MLKQRIDRMEQKLGGLNHCAKCGDGRWGRNETHINGTPHPSTPDDACSPDGICKSCGRYIEVVVIDFLVAGLAQPEPDVRRRI